MCAMWANSCGDVGQFAYSLQTLIHLGCMNDIYLFQRFGCEHSHCFTTTRSTYTRAIFRVFAIRIFVRVRVYAVHTPQGILEVWWHYFIAQKRPHILEVMDFLWNRQHAPLAYKYVHNLGTLPIMAYTYFLGLKKKPHCFVDPRNLFPENQVKILKFWVWIRTQPLLYYVLFV